jgi:hypothetical protein
MQFDPAERADAWVRGVRACGSVIQRTHVLPSNRRICVIGATSFVVAARCSGRPMILDFPVPNANRVDSLMSDFGLGGTTPGGRNARRLQSRSRDGERTDYAVNAGERRLPSWYRYDTDWSGCSLRPTSRSRRRVDDMRRRHTA